MIDATHAPRGRPRPPGVNVAGYLSGEFGLADAGRALLKAVRKAGVPVILNDYRVALHSNRHYEGLRFSRHNPFRVNLFIMNPDTYQHFVRRKGLDYLRYHTNIGSWYWETPSLPQHWRPFLKMHDELWAATRFVMESIRATTDVPVFHVPCPVEPTPIPVHVNRREFGLRNSDFVFLFTFDFYSTMARKNPLAAVRAFKQAFSPHESAVLILKVVYGNRFPKSLALLHEMAKASRIAIIDESFRADKMARLMACADSYISLHRSEGLGLGLAKALLWGKPVIATGYSGNMDFMSDRGALLVRHSLVRARQTHGGYAARTIWAEPDISHAAELMRFVFEHPEEAKAIGEKGRMEAAEALDPVRVANIVRERLAPFLN